jgi:hypothetical protein
MAGCTSALDLGPQHVGHVHGSGDVDAASDLLDQGTDEALSLVEMVAEQECCAALIGDVLIHAHHVAGQPVHDDQPDARSLNAIGQDGHMIG